MDYSLTFLSKFSLIISVINGQLVNDLFYKSGGSVVSELHEDCSFNCRFMSTKMVTLDIIMPLDEKCPEISSGMEIKTLYRFSPCSQKGSKSCSYCLHKRQKSIILKKSCIVGPPPNKCESKADIKEAKCFNCTTFGPTFEDDEL